MPLPDNQTLVIPENMEKIYQKYEEWDAWYSGDSNKLADVYASRLYYDAPKGRFWSKVFKDERKRTMHVPLAGDIATMSADLLFSESPKIKIPEVNGKDSDILNTQDRLDEILEFNGIRNKLIEAAETCAAMGGVFIKINWDRNFSDKPFFSIAQPDNAIPEFKYGFLNAVTFFKEVLDDYGVVWRWVERHEIINGRAYILNGLYKGTASNFGTRLPLRRHPMTEGLEEVIDTGLPTLLVRYIPNMKPNRLFRGSDIGMSDYSDSEEMMDALDEVFTSWMRDIRLGAGRIIVPETFLERSEDTGEFTFDVDKEVYSSLDVDPMTAGNTGLTIVQFEIRTEEHQKTSLELIDRIVSSAGYSPQSFGLKIEGRAESGTALNIRERKSFITASKKQRYWKPVLEDIFEIMLMVDNRLLGNRTPVFRPNVEIQDSVQQDILTLAQTADYLRRAQAATNRTLVAMIHPDWSKEQIEAEAEELNRIQGLNMPDPMQTGIG